MAFMEFQMTEKGTLYTCDCARCGATMFTHEWATWDHNERRDAMQAGTLTCDECPGTADPDTFRKVPRRQYACRYSAPGYMDCTEWDYGSNKRELARMVRDMYGND